MSMSSANDTIVFGDNGSITDASGNQWAINSAGQVTVNGTVDNTTDEVLQLAYVNGEVWQENINLDWWEKSSVNATWQPNGGTTTSPLPYIASINGAEIGTPGNQAGNVTVINDQYSNSWTLVPTSLGYEVAVNGVIDNTTAYVTELVYLNGNVYQENVNGDWWGKSSPTASWIGGTANNPYNYASATGVTVDSTFSYYSTGITDQWGFVWGINNQGQVTVGGVADSTTDQVLQIAYVDGKIWQENINGDWWYKSLPTDIWIAQDTTNPLPWASTTLTMLPNNTIVGFNTPDGVQYALEHPVPNVIQDDFVSNTTVVMTTGDIINLNQQFNGNITVVMGGGSETVNSNTGLIYGGSGIDTINASGGSGNYTSALTFIGGSGNATAFLVNVGYGGSGNTTLVGANGAHLYAGTGQTDFGVDNGTVDVNIMSFVSGLDHIDFQFGSELASDLANATFSNGVETIPIAAGGAFYVHANTPLAMSDFKLTTTT